MLEAAGYKSCVWRIRRVDFAAELRLAQQLLRYRSARAVPTNQASLKATLQSGDHVSDCVVEGDGAVEIWLPILREHAQIILPTTLV